MPQPTLTLLMTKKLIIPFSLHQIRMKGIELHVMCRISEVFQSGNRISCTNTRKSACLLLLA
jgi:hypothetical protein